MSGRGSATSAPEAATLWARGFVDELARAGVREIVLAPGSRSTPLVMAAARDPRIRLRVHLDERSAAFFALGVGKASTMPAAVLTTSGTAAANVFPAVVEAAQAETPLLVLTADRPPRLRDADANQAIDQVRLYGTYPRAFFDVATPRLDAPALRHLRALAGRAVAAALGPPAGPVHVNFPFDKPLEPVEGASAFAREHPLAATGRPEGRPFVEIARGARRASPATLETLARLLDSPRGVIVAGPSPEPDAVVDAVRRLAARTGFPVLADALSGVRYGDPCGAHIVAAYDLFLRDPVVRERLEPSLVLRVGGSPTSSAVADWLLAHDGVPHVVVDGGGRWRDHAAVATRYVHADAASTLGAVAESLTEADERTSAEAGDWRALWRAAEAAARDALADVSGEQHEGDALAAVVAAAPAGATLFVSSSMPIRDLDAFGLPRREPLRVLANRGASGIDGIVSTAFGVASQGPAPVVCVLGDIALFHDQNGLLWSREEDAPVVFVLIDNDGGGIFHALHIAQHEPEFTRYFATPHGLDFGHAAALHGIELREATIGELTGVLDRAIADGRTAILRVRTERGASHRRRDEVLRAVASRAREAIAHAAPGPSNEKRTSRESARR
jgi:2-succinyl-5-enolpyruvyl-6-hydroxy-3-cyclohexene-1-carboxylate synthase